MATLVILKLFFSVFISLFITLYVVPLISGLARRLGVLDVPDGKIKKHAKPVPYLGGLAVYIGFIATLAVVFPFENQIFLFIVGSTLLLFVGLIDDLVVIKPYQKFFGQCLATLCFLKAGFFLKETFFLKSYWNIPISLLWMLSVINAFNLVDVMDGLATSLAICATGSFMMIAMGLEQYDLALLLGSLLGALLGFFWYNRPQAEIYLGDAGSLFIGGFLATVPFLFKWGLYNWHGFLTPVVILAIPLLEVSTLVIVRSKKRIPFYQGSPDHFSLYLKENGWQPFEILLYVFSLSIILFGSAYAFVFNKVTLVELLGLALLFLMIWFSFLVYNRKKIV